MKRFPQIIGTGRTLYVDVDDTLIRSCGPRPAGSDCGRIIEIGPCRFEVIERNVDTLRRFAANADTTIIAWSNGGAIWADQVITAVGISDLVDVCLSKPSWFIDDRADAGFAGDPEKWIDAKPA